ALHGKHQPMTAERRSAREASSPPHRNKTPLTAEYESEPVQEDDDGTLNDENPADTTIEHSNPDIGETEGGSEATPAGVKISESVQNRPASVQNRDLRPETKTRRGAMHETALVNVVRSLRQYGLTYGTIVNLSNGVLTKSTLEIGRASCRERV